MSEHHTPVCPSCGYDLYGILSPGASINCPECGMLSTYQQSLDANKPPATIKHAVLGVLVIPSFFGIPFCLLLWFTGKPLDIFVLAPFIFLYLLIYSGVLIFNEHKHRKKFPAHARRSSWAAILLPIFFCLSVSSGVWLVVMWMCVEIISVI